jgi:predicted helicase
MSRFLINQYYKDLENCIDAGGSKKESSIRVYFQNLLHEYCKKKDLYMVAELHFKTITGKKKYPDGTIKDALRLDWGYWESKDQYDDLDKEIQAKFDIGYPRDNILFEDSQTAVLFQAGQEVARVPMNDPDQLDKILNMLIDYERNEVTDFRTAIEKFKEEIPQVAEALRELIKDQKDNQKYISARNDFLELCRETINPDIVVEDVREMIVQHILTEDIFNTIFDEVQFHRENNIARELEAVIFTFFHHDTKKNFKARIHHYYAIIKAAASNIADHKEKQKFLKIIYENFYKAYNPAGADRLGVVYTPNEIVKFMIESTDYLCYEHFGKMLHDKNVEILDPATGTGTYITELIDYITKPNLEYKYKNEIHANEVSILPYYIANLNIEYAYNQKMGEYAEFKNICFVDTLDNMAFAKMGQQTDAFASFSNENKERIIRQNEKKISVIIGNPPYNANQMNENDNNKNREYPEIDKRIKDTFIRNSTAQKTKVYDMYSRFYRWAMDRIDHEGILALITNRSFINSRTFDGFRKSVQDEYDHIYIIDTQSDVRANPKIAGTTHNVFGIQTGVAIAFMIKKTEKTKHCRINYYTMTDEMRKEEKLDWLSEHKFRDIPFENIRPDKKHNWIDIPDNDFEELLAVCSKVVKAKKSKEAIFENYQNGIKTNRDEWVYDHSSISLERKIKFFSEIYNDEVRKYSSFKSIPEINNLLDLSIKWSRDLKNELLKDRIIDNNHNQIINALFRPYSPKYYYTNHIMSDVLTENHFHIYGRDFDKSNRVILFAGTASTQGFQLLASDKVTDYHFTGDSQCLPLYRYDADGKRHDNITDWGLEQFRTHYAGVELSKEDIFHYTYAVLHCPEYRSKYELNLKREFPRLPYYEDFHRWAAWGLELMDLHIGFEEVEPYPLKRTDSKWTLDHAPKAKLKADKARGLIVLDEITELSGIPTQAWEYKLGNRSAMEWILDQYKEKKPRDPTIREKFNTYKFADYKDKVIDLLGRVCRVSIETIRILGEMKDKQE